MKKRKSKSHVMFRVHVSLSNDALRIFRDLQKSNIGASKVINRLLIENFGIVVSPDEQAKKLDRECKLLAAEMNKEISVIQAEYMKDIEKLQQKRDNLVYEIIKKR